MDKLKLLALNKDFTVEEKYKGYSIRDKESNLEATIDTLNEIAYYIGGSEYLKIDINRLLKLKEFCEIMVQE